jgi:hypothetical protein
MTTQAAELSDYGVKGRGAWDNAVREVDIHQNMVKTATFISVKALKYQPARCVFSLGTHLLNSTYCSSVRRPSLVYIFCHVCLFSCVIHDDSCFVGVAGGGGGGGVDHSCMCQWGITDVLYIVTTLPFVVRRCRISDMPFTICDISSTCGCMDV